MSEEKISEELAINSAAGFEEVERLLANQVNNSNSL